MLMIMVKMRKGPSAKGHRVDFRNGQTLSDDMSINTSTFGDINTSVSTS